MILSLGVLDVPYDEGETTYQVAKKLEYRYGVMDVFVDEHRDEIENSVIDAFMGEIESMKMGKPKSTLMNRTLGGIEELFRDYIDADEWQKVTGEIIMSALLGITSRNKEGTGLPRPAFIDTGLYQASFRAWLDDNGE